MLSFGYASVFSSLSSIMSCFNVRRLLPERRAWRAFTKKLQTKLHKLHTSKAIRKPKTNRLKPTSKSVFSHREGKKRTAKVRRIFSYRHQKRIPPVYVDQLFVEESVSTSVAATRNPPYANKSRLDDDQKVAVPGTSKEHMNDGRNNTTTADDMWESLVLASPQMQGINERAEEFIARFRAEMQLQEISATHL